MKLTKFNVVGSLLMATILFGCASDQVSVRSGIQEVGESEIAARPVELRRGVDIKKFRRLPLGLFYGQIQSNTSAFKKKEVSDYMNIRFQSELSNRDKRFDYIALWGADESSGKVKGDKLISALIDSDQIDPSEGLLSLGWTINIQEKREPDGTYGQIFKWYCTVNATAKEALVDDGGDVKPGKVKFATDFDLPIIEKSQRLNSMGGVKSGFNYRSDADVQALMQEIIIAASQRIAEDLGRRYPIGGKIVGADGLDTMTLDKGSEQGVGEDMQMVVFARRNNVNIPIANAVAAPSENESTLTVWRMADSSKAKSVIKEINGDPMAWEKKTGNGLYAVRALPPSDRDKGTRFEK